MMFLLAFLYLLTGLAYIVKEIFYLKRKKMLSFISMFRVMYAFIFGFLPAIVIFRLDIGISKINVLYENSDYLRAMSFTLLISILIYVILSLIYEGTSKSSAFKTPYTNVSRRGQLLGICIALLIGGVSLYLWTRAFGSIFNMMKSADSVRANYSTVYNPFAFLEHFTKVFPVCAYLSFSLLIERRKERKRIVLEAAVFIISVFFSLVTMLCTDARGSIGMLLIVLAIYYLFTKLISKKITIPKFVFIAVLFFAIGYIAIVTSEYIMNFIRYGTFTNENGTLDIFSSIEKEFGYVINNQVAVYTSINNEPFNLLITNDGVGAVFAWIPSRFIPFTMPVNLWDYNTKILIQQEFFYGQCPTDFVSSSLYLFGPLGILIMPVMIGWLFKKIDTGLFRQKNHQYLMVYYVVLMYYCCLWWPSHFSLKYTVTILFGVFLVHLLVRITSKITKNNYYLCK